MNDEEKLEEISKVLFLLMTEWDKKINSKSTSTTCKLYYRKCLNELKFTLGKAIENIEK